MNSAPAHSAPKAHSVQNKLATAAHKLQLPQNYPWERLPTESSEAWRAFNVYLEFPLEQRSVLNAAKALNLSQHVVELWYRRHRWYSRALERDSRILGLASARSLLAKAEAAERHAALADQIVRKTMERISTLRPKQIPIESIPNFARTGVELERLARGETNGSASAAPNVSVSLQWGDNAPAWAASAIDVQSAANRQSIGTGLPGTIEYARAAKVLKRARLSKGKPKHQPKQRGVPSVGEKVLAATPAPIDTSGLAGNENRIIDVPEKIPEKTKKTGKARK